MLASLARRTAALPAVLSVLLALPLSLGSFQVQASAAPLADSKDSYVSGTVYADDDQDGARDKDEDGIDGVEVTLRSSGTVDTKRAKTNSKGQYEFKNLASGTYLVTLEPPYGLTAARFQQIEVRVDGKSGTKFADFPLVTASVASARSTVAPTATPVPTATPSIAQRLASLSILRSGRFTLQGRSDDNGVRSDFAAEGFVLQPGDLDMRLSLDGEQLAIVVVGSRAYRRPLQDEDWKPANVAQLRASHGVLSAVDALDLSRLAGQVATITGADRVDENGESIRYVRLELAPPPATRPVRSGSPQLQPLGGSVEAWASASDGVLRTVHLQLEVPSSRDDLSGAVRPASFDAWVRYADQNAAFTINEPVLVSAPTAVPARAAVVSEPIQASVARPPAIRPAAAAPDQAPPPTAVPQPTLPTPAADLERTGPKAAAAERALLALVRGAGPKPGSWAEQDSASLTVPWRGQLGDPAGDQPSTDGTAALSAILAAYGVEVPTEELTALAERWQGPWGPGEPVRLTTLVRIASRGSLRPLGPAYGTGGDEWTAALARDYLRRGYPVLALVSPALLSAPPPPTDQKLPDRYIAVIGFSGDDLLYHDPAIPEGAARRVPMSVLDRAWAGATTARQGVAFGFGTTIIGLLNLAPRQTASLATPEPVPTLVVLPTAVPQPTVSIRPAEQSLSFGMHPSLLGFFGLLAGGAVFVIARLLR
jgi:hypothetical protein